MLHIIPAQINREERCPLTEESPPDFAAVNYDGQLGARIRSLRETRGMSIRGLARLAGTSQETVRQLESDPRANPTLETLLGVQQALGLASLEQLLGGFDRFPSRELAEERHSGDGQVPLA